MILVAIDFDMPGPDHSSPDPKRFAVSRATLWSDRCMSWLIRFGGGAIILAVFAILYFMLAEALPLFQTPGVTAAGEVTGGIPPRVMGVDEWGEMPFLYAGGSQLHFQTMTGGRSSQLEIPGLAGRRITAFSFDPLQQRLTYGLEDGQVGSVRVVYERRYRVGNGSPQVEARLEEEPLLAIEGFEGAVSAVHDGDAGTTRLVVAIHGGAAARVSVLMLTKKRALVGESKLRLTRQFDLNGQLSGRPAMVRASSNGTMVLVACDNGVIDYFERDGQELVKRQSFEPFASGLPARMDLLLGGVSMVLTSREGFQQQWSLYRRELNGDRLFGKTKEFPALPAGQEVVFANSHRNRSFLTGAGRTLEIRHSTTGKVRWQAQLDHQAVIGVIDGKNRYFLVADHQGMVHRYAIDDPHPEAGLQTFFGKVWYEGGDAPVYQWQSTGGTNDFEPKLSLVPLIFGTLKGSVYALLFSVPVALLAAVFSAAFLPRPVKQVIKPMMEIMASLPSVVLGFLALVWLGPLLETRVPSVILMVAMVPLGALVAGRSWSHWPVALRNRLDGGWEWLLVLPFLLAGGALGWLLGPVIESWWFIYRDPISGQAIADFRLWWPQVTGTGFEEQNCLVVGFIMGFAVIPVIFTIAEDALANVPRSLTAASAALGASRWQVVWTVMLPMAAPGIFSAVMIGFGRAVGETMIMVMATGNTPIMEWDPFNGMRTLAANIAGELPETAHGSTHYRTLLLSAVVLFLMTSVMNTLAEILRQRLRERCQQI